MEHRCIDGDRHSMSFWSSSTLILVKEGSGKYPLWLSDILNPDLSRFMWEKGNKLGGMKRGTQLF